MMSPNQIDVMQRPFAQAETVRFVQLHVVCSLWQLLRLAWPIVALTLPIAFSGARKHLESEHLTHIRQTLSRHQTVGQQMDTLQEVQAYVLLKLAPERLDFQGGGGGHDTTWIRVSKYIL